MTISRSMKAAAFALTLVLIAGVAVPMLSPSRAGAVFPQCSDAIDNDQDGRIDYPQDADCSSLDDQYEGAGGNGGVFVTVTDGREEISAGDSLTYIITIRQDRDDSNNVDVLFTLPAQARVQGASDGGSIDTTSVRWNNLTVYRGGSKTLTVTALVTPYAEANHLIVARATADGVQATDTTMIRTTTTSSAFKTVTLSVSDGRKTAEPGDVLDYDVIVRNPTSRTFMDNVNVNVGGNLQVDAVYDGGEKVNTNVVWRSVTVAPNSTRTLHFRGTVAPHERRMAFVDVTATAGTARSVDRTVIGSSTFPTGNLSVTMTDGLTHANRNDTLTYVVRLTNRDNTVEAHGFATASLPMYTQYVNASNGAAFDGNNVRWTNLVIPAGSTIELRYSVRIREDAPRNAVLTATIEVKGGATSKDSTGLDNGTFVYNGGANQNNGLLAVGTPASSRLVFRKSADRAEVLPGDRISYTIYVQNRYDTPLSNVVITDRFNPSELSLLSVQDNADISTGRILWTIPTLAPGQTWQTTYTLEISPTLARGISVGNSATISSNGVDARAVTSTVYTLRTVVMNATPATGAGDFVAALEDTSRLLTPITSGATSVGGFLSMAVSGLAAGAGFGRRLF